MRSSHTRFVASSVAMALSLSLTTAPMGAASDLTDATATDLTTSAAGLDPALAGRAQQLESGLGYLMAIPDSVLVQGDVATKEWVEQHPAETDIAIAPGSPFTVYASVVGCTNALISITAGNLVGAAKLLKIKKYIKELGGLKEAVQTMWGASFSFEKMKAAGGALGALGAELIGVTDVREQCFN